MMLDATSFLLATGAAALLVGGGAFLRPPSVKVLAADPPLGNAHDPESSDPSPSRSLTPRVAEAEQALVMAREELATVHEAREAQRKEMVELRQRAERQQQASDAESKRLGSELVTEKGRSVELEKALAAAKNETKALSEELTKVRAAGSSSSDSKTITALQDEIQSLQPLKTKLVVATEERDAARAKVEALERLIEGVRARSRQLAEELKALKKE